MWYPWPISDVIKALQTISNQIERLSAQIAVKDTPIMATLNNIQAAVTAEKTVEDSVVTLLQQLAAQLKDVLAANDPATAQAIVDQINANAKALADAVTANTPAA